MIRKIIFITLCIINYVNAEEKTCAADDPSCISNNSSGCIDLDNTCQTKALEGKCTTKDDMEYMQQTCRLSCGSCVPYKPNMDVIEGILEYGVAQEVNDLKGNADKTMELMDSTIEYMKDVLEDLSDDTPNRCRLTRKDCIATAANTKECETNDRFKMQCGPACRYCEELNKEDEDEDEDEDEIDDEELLEILEEFKEEDDDPDEVNNYMLIMRGIERYGVEQRVDGNEAMETYDTIKETLKYMKKLSTDDPNAISNCQNRHNMCSFWGSTGECQNNPNFMRKDCAPACQSCVKTFEDLLAEQKRPGETNVDGYELALRAIAKFGITQEVKGETTDKTMLKIKDSLIYLQGLPNELKANCMNKHQLCAYWSMMGECDKNVHFMRTECAPSCLSCDYKG